MTSARAGLEDASRESDADGSFLDALRTGVNGGDNRGNVNDASGDGEGGRELMDDEGRVSGLGEREQEKRRVPEGKIGNQAVFVWPTRGVSAMIAPISRG